MSQLDLSNIDNTKKFSIALSKFLKEKGIENAKQSLILEGIAQSFGQPNWNTFLAIYREANKNAIDKAEEKANSLLNIPHQWDVSHYIHVDNGGYRLSYNVKEEILEIKNSFFNYVGNIHYFKISLKGMLTWGRKLNFIFSQEPANNSEEEKVLKKRYEEQKDYQEGNTRCGIRFIGFSMFIKNEYGQVELKTNLEKLLAFFVELNTYNEAKTISSKNPEAIMSILHELDQMFDNEEKEKKKAKKGFLYQDKIAIKSFEEHKKRKEDFIKSLPFNLVEIVKYAKEKFNMPQEEVLKVCCSLYEKGLQSYPKTDCKYIPESNWLDASEILNHITQTYPTLIEKINEINLEIKGLAWDNTKITTHYGIIPTKNKANLVELNKNEQQIYFAICEKYINQFVQHSVFYESSYNEGTYDDLIKEIKEEYLIDENNNVSEKDLALNYWKMNVQNIYIYENVIDISKVIQAFSDQELFHFIHLDLNNIFMSLEKNSSEKAQSDLAEIYRLPREMIAKLNEIRINEKPKKIAKKSPNDESLDMEIMDEDFDPFEYHEQNDLIKKWEMTENDILIQYNGLINKIQLSGLIELFTKKELCYLIKSKINLTELFTVIAKLKNPSERKILNILKKYQIDKEIFNKIQKRIG